MYFYELVCVCVCKCTQCICKCAYLNICVQFRKCFGGSQFSLYIFKCLAEIKCRSPSVCSQSLSPPSCLNSIAHNSFYQMSDVQIFYTKYLLNQYCVLGTCFPLATLFH